MNLLLKSFSIVALGLSTITAYAAAPSVLTTHNNTNEESNAYIAGTIPSPYPTPANSTKQIAWNMVRLACFGHTTGNLCPAVIKMATNTANPIEIATVNMDLTTGVITITKVSNSGYTLTINGPGEATVTKN